MKTFDGNYLEHNEGSKIWIFGMILSRNLALT